MQVLRLCQRVRIESEHESQHDTERHRHREAERSKQTLFRQAVLAVKGDAGGAHVAAVVNQYPQRQGRGRGRRVQLLGEGTRLLQARLPALPRRQQGTTPSGGRFLRGTACVCVGVWWARTCMTTTGVPESPSSS